MKYYKEALEIAEKIGDIKGKSRGLNNIGRILDDRGDLEGALNHFKESLKISEQIGDLRGKTIKLNNIGKTLYSKGELDKALTYFKKALNTAEQAGGLKVKTFALNNIGKICSDKGDLDSALSYFKEALQISEQIGDIKGKSLALNNVGKTLCNKGDLEGAMNNYKKALKLIQKEVKGKELDFKMGKVDCPNPNCNNQIQIKVIGELNAFIETCPFCQIKFSLWMVGPSSSKYIINILSEDNIELRNITSGNLYLQEQTGKETLTRVPEWLFYGAKTNSNIANLFDKKGDLLNACYNYFQAASMYRGLGFIETSENELKILENLLPNISMEDRDRFAHKINQLRKQTSETLRSRAFTYIFISCPNCGTEHQIRASLTTVAYELCSQCRAKFSVFYDNETQEFYTNILEKPKIKRFRQPEKSEPDLVKFCARCGLNVGIIARFCARCGLKILRD